MPEDSLGNVFYPSYNFQRDIIILGYEVNHFSLGFLKHLEAIKRIVKIKIIKLGIIKCNLLIF